MSYEKKERIISLTRAELITLMNNNNLIQSMNYFISDRNIWLVAKDINIFNSIGKRSERIVINQYYTPQTIIGFNTMIYLGIYGQTINQGSVPPSDFTFGGDAYRAVWGGKVWERDISGVDTPGTNQGSIQAGWTLIPTSDPIHYTTKVFEVGYNILTDVINYQRDDRNNIIKNITIGGFETINMTDWGNVDIENNETQGVFNNWRGSLAAQIRNNKCFGLIRFNRNGGVINDNKGRNILQNSNSGNIIDNIMLFDIENNTNNGSIQANRSTGIFSNSNGGSITVNLSNFIFSNSNGGTITNNKTAYNINSNSNTGSISDNDNTGSISSNNINVTNISFNSNKGGIELNSNFGSINNNENIGLISNNSCLTIQRNGNNGNINNNTGGISIQNNYNNGNISNNSAGVGVTVGMSKNINNGNIVSCVFTSSMFVIENINNGAIGPGIYSVSVSDTQVNK